MVDSTLLQSHKWGRKKMLWNGEMSWQESHDILFQLEWEWDESSQNSDLFLHFDVKWLDFHAEDALHF